VPGPAIRRWLDAPARLVLAHIEGVRSLASLPVLLIYRVTDQQTVIDADAARWAELLWVSDRSRLLARLLYAFPEFRSVYYYRLQHGNPAGALLGRLARQAWKGVEGLELTAAIIGPGLFVSHGQGTVLAAARIGANLQVHQGVTIGWDYRGDRGPIIGDDVFIGAGAKVLGAVTIGDRARIGANAVVVHDVPAGATAVGVPARIIREGRHEC
jgi:serine O-acetyltransferase